MSHFDSLGLTKCPPVELSDPPSAKRHRSVNSRGRRRSMWACAFRATFISSISFIYLLILLYSHSFSKHCHSLHRETFEGGGTESFSETCCPKPCAFITHATRQSHAQQTPQRAREDELGGLHTHTHTSSSVRVAVLNVMQIALFQMKT